MFIINIFREGLDEGAIILEQPQNRKSCDAAHRSFSLIYLFNLVGAPPYRQTLIFLVRRFVCFQGVCHVTN